MWMTNFKTIQIFRKFDATSISQFMADFCEEYSPNISSMVTLPVEKCSFLEHIHLQKFNYTDPYNSKGCW